MCGVVSLCAVTHRGLHAWNWTREVRGGSFEEWERDKSEGRGLLHVHWGGSRDAYFMHH